MKFTLPLLALTLVACGNSKNNPTLASSDAVSMEEGLPASVRLTAAERQLGAVCDLGATPATCSTGPEMRYRLEDRRTAVVNYLRLQSEVGQAASVAAPMRARAAQLATELRAAPEQLTQELAKGDARLNRQRELIAQINSEMDCGLVTYSRGQQMTFGREVGLVQGCSPLQPRDYARAARLMRDLAEVSVPTDAVAYRERAQAFESFGPDVAYLKNLQRQLLELNVVQIDRGFVKVNHIGHPFGSTDDTYLLKAYAFAADRLARRVAAPDIVFNRCLAPACDPQIFKVAQAVTTRPLLDAIYLADGLRVVAPNPSSFIPLADLVLANGAMGAALGLEPVRYDARAFDSYLTDNDQVLVFPNVFPVEHIAVSIDKYTGKTLYPYAYKFLALFQEARNVVSALTRLQRQTGVAAGIQDLRFEAADDSGRMLSLTKLSSGGYRLGLKVLDPKGGMSIEATRQALMASLEPFLADSEKGVN